MKTDYYVLMSNAAHTVRNINIPAVTVRLLPVIVEGKVARHIQTQNAKRVVDRAVTRFMYDC